MKVNIKKFYNLLIIFLALLFFIPLIAKASVKPVNAYLFYGDACPHCANEQFFLQKLKQQYPDLRIYTYEVYSHPENADLLIKVAENLNKEVEGVPFLIIGDQTFIGFAEGLTTMEIENKVKECLSGICTDRAGQILGVQAEIEPADTKKEQQTAEKNIIKTKLAENHLNQETELLINQTATQTTTTANTTAANKQSEIIGRTINLPFIGTINPAKFSLPILTIILGALDGFNPCAMWVLLFLISLLLGMENHKRMWILGIAFIISSASVYFIFMSAWLNLILFLGLIIWIRIFIGLIALASSAYNLKEFFCNKNPSCKLTGGEKKQRIFEKLKLSIRQNSLLLAFIGIVGLAFMVNLVELICSAGLPAIYTQILALNDLPTWKYYSYILLYIFFFMLDDLLVFIAAMITLHVTGITTKYTRATKLIGGIIMLFIGFSLIFKPEWVMFG